MKCPYCSYDNDDCRRFKFTFIDTEGNYKDRTLTFSVGFGKYVDKSVSMFVHDVWECADCGALFSPPRE